jgi:hypothetical protein
MKGSMKMFIFKGFIFRRAINLKNLGERLKWPWLVRLGLKLKGAVCNAKS